MRDESTELMRARSAGIATKEVGGEVVVYDLETDKVHLLNPVTSTIWRLASEGDGVTTEAATAAVTAAFPDQDAPGDLTLAALQELRAAGLLLSDTGAPSFGLDRRRMLKIAGGAAVLGPLVTTILAPPAAATHSVDGGTPWGQTAVNGCAHCKPLAPATDGVCGTDGLCGVCIANQTSACGGNFNADSQTRCCTGNACTNVGTTGPRCCQPTGGGVGTGTCCATNSSGTCVCTPPSSVPTVLDGALCCSPATQLKAGTNACCFPNGTTDATITGAGFAQLNTNDTRCCSSKTSGSNGNRTCVV